MDVLTHIAISNTRRRSGEDVLQRAIAAVSPQHRRRESEERVPLVSLVVRTAWNQRARQRNVLQARAAAKRQVAGIVINGDDRASALLRRGIGRCISGSELVLLCRKRQRVDLRLLVRSRCTGWH